MRDLRIEFFILTLVLVIFTSCQKEELIIIEENDSPTEINSFEPIVLTTHVTPVKKNQEFEPILLPIYDGEIDFHDTVDAREILPEGIEKLEVILDDVTAYAEEAMTQEEICNIKTAQVYKMALEKANATCKAVYAEVNCDLDGTKVSAIIYVRPTVICSMPLMGEPTK